jgi:hypothetical protein
VSSRSLAQFQELAEEISKLGGDSLLWEARLAVGKQDESLIRALMAQVEPAIGEVPVKME